MKTTSLVLILTIALALTHRGNAAPDSLTESKRDELDLMMATYAAMIALWKNYAKTHYVHSWGNFRK